MNYKNEEKKAIELLKSFESALNAADSKAIPAFYTEDGQFMPAGFKTVSKPASLLKGVDRYLLGNGFHIEYSVEDLKVDGHFAFITAQASTSRLEPGSELAASKSTRDFFVLKNTGGQWKIYRYLFNNQY